MVIPLSLALMGLGGCNPYERWEGDEFNAGPVDPINFPPQYLGTGGNRQLAGAGRFTAARAYVEGTATEHFIFPFSPTQLSATNPLAAASSTAAPKPNAYVFDGCTAPAGYEFDAVRDAVDLSQQGVIFSALPSASYAAGAEPANWSYVPLVSRVPVTSKSASCQAIKSEPALVKRAGQQVDLNLTAPAPVTGKQVGVSDGTLLAFAIIEPGAAVYHVGENANNSTGVGLQKWGWYNQYLLAYLDGGEVPKAADGRLGTQRVYYPRSPVTVGTTNRAVTVGQGYDVLTARRGEAGYSPVCEVVTYDAGGPLTAAQLPKSAAEIETLYGATVQPPTRAYGNKSPAGDPYVYCLQLE
ncbi:hypothetical protein [Cystobacter fuscus]|nr:hypothetical protein [Cystobacter fuscus]